MTDEQTKIMDKFHSFLEQRNHKTNAAMQEAQRLVNLYRVLKVFGEDFVEKYNTMLLGASEEVQMAMKALVGGVEVRHYLEFLQTEANLHDDDPDNDYDKAGWLPPPEQDKTSFAAAGKGGDYVSGAEWNAFIRAQEEQLVALTETLRAEQKEALARLMSQISGVLPNKKTPVSTPDVPLNAPQYSEIIEEKR